jgi:hypothetical protein
MEAAANPNHRAFRMLGYCFRVGRVLLDRRHPASLRAALSNVRQQPAALQLGAWGENWHRNHHSDANAARFGRRWWQIDVGWYVISGLKALKLASDIRPTRDIVKKDAQQAA